MELDHEFTVPVPVDRAWSVLLDVERVALCMPGATLDSIDGEEYAGRLKVKLGAMTITYKGTARIVAADESRHTLTIEGSGKEARGAGTASATIQAQLHDEGDNTRVTVHTKLNVTGRPAQFGRNILSEVGGKLISRFAKNLSDELLADPGAAAEEATQGAVDQQAAAAAVSATADTPPNGTPVPEQAAKTSDEGTPGLSLAPPPADSAAGSPGQAPGPATPAERPAAVPQPRAASPAENSAGSGPVAVPFRERGDDDAINLLEFAGPSVAKRAVPALGVVAAVLTVRYLFRRRRGRHHR